MIKKTLENEIEKVVKRVFDKEVVFSVSANENLEFGDYATNVAMVLKVGNPKETAEKIKDELLKSEKINKIISKTESAGPGFLNFWLKDKVFVQTVEDVIKQKEKYGTNDSRNKKKIIVEYTDPNPFKEFHIGHLMSNAIGEATAKLFEFSGAEVKRACYQGDVGMHVAKNIANKLRKEEDSFVDIADSGRSYADGSSLFEKEREFVADVNKKIYERSDERVNKLYDQGRELSLKYFEEIYGLLGMEAKKDGKHFDYYFFESKTGELGKKIVEEYLKKGVFEKSDGAVIFSEEKSGLHTRVFINSEGLPTYEAKELGLAKIKHDKYKYDTSVVVTGNEINDYFKVLLKAMEFIFPKLAGNTKHISHGMLRLPTGKMSSRTGDVIKAMDLLSNIEKRVLDKIADRELSEEEKKDIAKKVALAAVKYSILKQSPGKDVIFDLDKSISFEGDSGPYLQYTYVRALSVLNLAKEKGVKSSLKINNLQIGEIEKYIQRFPDIVAEAQVSFAPNHICTYLIELAHSFNAYYANNKIVDEENKELSSYRVSLTEAVSITIKNGLSLLGIQVPDKM